MLCEVRAEATYVPHHKKKIAFLFAAMRHFAEQLRACGVRVHYVAYDVPENLGSLDAEVKRALGLYRIDRVILTEPGEYRVLVMYEALKRELAVPLEIRVDDRFLSTRKQFADWAAGKKQLRMEYFYREMRKRYHILIEPDGTPTGGAWNYDKENRKLPAKGLRSPKRLRHARSAITREVLALVEQQFPTHFGDLHPFYYAITRDQALLELDHFIDELLPQFGDYQDAMVAGEPYLYHSLISSYLNAGLLLPLEICRKAEAAYRAGKAPLAAAEGFIRQILGWREYVRGIYWHYMPDYAAKNHLGATRPLPAFYWDGKTDMFCVAEAVRHTREHAYSHHIQRLMVTGNFALLAGINPVEVCEWYLLVYSDAYEWVELPNTLGMALFGDGGIMASKPYAASGKYIHRMSNFCARCTYDPEQMTGENACPFNALYWDFIDRHALKLRHNQRMSYMYASWEKMVPTKQQALREKAAQLLRAMAEGTL